MASIQKRSNGMYRARYQDDGGAWHARHFEKRKDADAFLNRIRGDLSRGEFVDPKGARTLFKDYVTTWRARTSSTAVRRLNSSTAG
jgi:hypothetical protein